MGEKLNEQAEVEPTKAEIAIELAQRALHSMGLYDASNDFYPTTDHDDESWAINIAQ